MGKFVVKFRQEDCLKEGRTHLAAEPVRASSGEIWTSFKQSHPRKKIFGNRCSIFVAGDKEQKRHGQVTNFLDMNDSVGSDRLPVFECWFDY